MKKILVASSALVAVAFAGQASASEKISLSVSGYMEQWAGVADQDRGESRNAFQSDTEVHFKGSTTLDNGIEVGAAIEFEGENSEARNSADTGSTGVTSVDEQYLYVNGGFGQIKLGAEDGAAADMGITGPAAGPVGVNDGDLPNWVAINSVPDTVPAGGDSKRITYYTPVLGGFRAGLSYADDDSSENNDTVTSGDNRVSGGLEFRRDFDGVSLGVSLVGEHMGEGEWYGLGATVGFGNFTVGGSVSETDGEFGFGEATAKRDDTTDFEVGVAYAMDAATISLGYAYGENDSTTASDGVDELNTVDLGLAYTLGAGVTWKSSVFWFDDKGQDVGNADDNDGYGVVTGLALSF
ncbi:MAG: porin [Thalassospira sp.]|uniref:porin n=1 Tax=Thalassospira sp. TaxID=1912094 RepID=UPI0032EC2E78